MKGKFIYNSCMVSFNKIRNIVLYIIENVDFESCWINQTFPIDLAPNVDLLYTKLDFESCKIKPIFDCNYTSPIDLTSNIISFSVKSIGKVYLHSKFGLI